MLLVMRYVTRYTLHEKSNSSTPTLHRSFGPVWDFGFPFGTSLETTRLEGPIWRYKPVYKNIYFCCVRH